ncbi:MAG: hypothetical protein KDB18_09145 [Salinibacterium sp.]|nr:hypothetical protein [Salinibacterium sp.]
MTRHISGGLHARGETFVYDERYEIQPEKGDTFSVLLFAGPDDENPRCLSIGLDLPESFETIALHKRGELVEEMENQGDGPLFWYIRDKGSDGIEWSYRDDFSGGGSMAATIEEARLAMIAEYDPSPYYQYEVTSGVSASERSELAYRQRQELRGLR